MQIARGNGTALWVLSSEMYSKCMQFMHQVNPRTRRVIYVVSAGNPLARTSEIQEGARQFASLKREQAISLTTFARLGRTSRKLFLPPAFRYLVLQRWDSARLHGSEPSYKAVEDRDPLHRQSVFDTLDSSFNCLTQQQDGVFHRLRSAAS
jgi:hypothetical protein